MMTTTAFSPLWRIDPRDDGGAWLYAMHAPGVVPQAGSAALAEGYVVASEPDVVADPWMGVCLRYRMIQVRRDRRWSPVG